jgi:hypothetical protein
MEAAVESQGCKLGEQAGMGILEWREGVEGYRLEDWGWRLEELVLEREDRDLKLEVVIGKLEVVLLVDLVLQASIVEEQVLVQISQ